MVAMEITNRVYMAKYYPDIYTLLDQILKMQQK